MRVLITAASSRLSRELSAALSRDNDVLLTDRSEVPTDQRFVSCDLGHDRATNDLVRGMDAIVHSIESVPGASAATRLDVAMRCTYNLLRAAVEEGVPRLVYLSSLRVLDRYDEGLAVTERWRPVPGVELATLGCHLGEYVCREFARDGRTSVVCLRLGELTWRDGGSTGATSSSALYPEDAIQAVDRALAAGRQAWRVFHIQSSFPDARYLTATAQKHLGYRPLQGS